MGAWCANPPRVLFCIAPSDSVWAPLNFGCGILCTKTTPTLNRLYKQAQSSPSEFSHGREWQCTKLRPPAPAPATNRQPESCAPPTLSSLLDCIPFLTTGASMASGAAAVAVVARAAALRPRCASATPSAETFAPAGFTHGRVPATSAAGQSF